MHIDKDHSIIRWCATILKKVKYKYFNEMPKIDENERVSYKYRISLLSMTQKNILTFPI